MLEKIKARLGSNYQTGDDSVIEDLIEDMTIVALSTTNRKTGDQKVDPYVKEAVIKAYLRRGDEGSKGSNEGSLGTSYEDIKVMRNDLIKDGLRLRK